MKAKLLQPVLAMHDLLISTSTGVPSLCRKVADKQAIYFQMPRACSRDTSVTFVFKLEKKKTKTYIYVFSQQRVKMELVCWILKNKISHS